MSLHVGLQDGSKGSCGLDWFGEEAREDSFESHLKSVRRLYVTAWFQEAVELLRSSFKGVHSLLRFQPRILHPIPTLSLWPIILCCIRLYYTILYYILYDILLYCIIYPNRKKCKGMGPVSREPGPGALRFNAAKMLDRHS